MKKLFKILVPVATVGLLLAGCGAHHSNSHHTSGESYTPSGKVGHSHKESAKGQHASVKTATSAKQQQPSGKIKSNSSKAKQNGNYTVQTSSKHPLSKVAKATGHATKKQSVSAENGLPTVDLGHGIKGNVDRGAGQVYVSYTVNGKQYISHGNDVNEPADTAINNAKANVAKQFE